MMKERNNSTEPGTSWGMLSAYQRFEHIIALTLTFVISLIIVVALWRLISQVFELLVLGVLDPQEHSVFQSVFGMIMTLLIAMEFKHSILRVMERQEHIIQVRTVVLIAILALSRKFIILDAELMSAATIAALGFSVLVLGVVHWILVDPKRKEPTSRAADSAAGHQVKSSE